MEKPIIPEEFRKQLVEELNRARLLRANIRECITDDPNLGWVKDFRKETYDFLADAYRDNSTEMDWAMVWRAQGDVGRFYEELLN